MARKPNYDFERKERERLKNEKKAARAQAKEKPAEAVADAVPEAAGHQPPSDRTEERPPAADGRPSMVTRGS